MKCLLSQEPLLWVANFPVYIAAPSNWLPFSNDIFAEHLPYINKQKNNSVYSL